MKLSDKYVGDKKSCRRFCFLYHILVCAFILEGCSNYHGAEEIKTPKNVVYTEGAAENMEIDSTVESESESQMEPESEPEPEIVEADCQHISTN